MNEDDMELCQRCLCPFSMATLGTPVAGSYTDVWLQILITEDGLLSFCPECYAILTNREVN